MNRWIASFTHHYVCWVCDLSMFSWTITHLLCPPAPTNPSKKGNNLIVTGENLILILHLNLFLFKVKGLLISQSINEKSLRNILRDFAVLDFITEFTTFLQGSQLNYRVLDFITDGHQLWVISANGTKTTTKQGLLTHRNGTLYIIKWHKQSFLYHKMT